ncbi:LysR family transcriptional regulator [Aureliella helgolandensis]|uniref:HTH-type transcriptional regulator CysB n=1 Tax=Aureliella helgolandensis TaxID=2527968 RepID=A0A518GA86_9BACT|nr:LysR family transcriptional regulator [Aureliella helgolandensis]QDV25518.1 HTH-type transcriptional regulator CysB [Aureliella helgolandensis]
MDRNWFDRAEALNVQQVNTFCRVYEHGGYAGAAEYLDQSGPTLWEHVKALEKIYQAQLFERSGRNIRPTDAGHALYQLLLPLLATVESTFERLAEETDDTPTEVRLVTGVRMMLEELGAPLQQFHAAYPTVRIKLLSADNRTAQQFVTEGKADLALLIEPPQELIAPGITCLRLYPIDYLAALPKRHRLIRKDNLCLEDLVDEPLIVGNPDTVGRSMLEQAHFRLGLTRPLRIVAETDNSAVTLACVRAGLGVGIIAGRPSGSLEQRIHTKSLAQEIGRVHVVAAYREGRTLTRTLQTLVDLIGCIP